MEFKTSTMRAINVGASLVFFIIFLGLSLYAEMRNGSPEIINGYITGYWYVEPAVRAFLWIMTALGGAITVLALLWPGPWRGSVEYKAAAGKSELQCPGCSAPVGKDYMACPACTLPLLQKCTSCGERLPASYNACPRCGNVIRNPHSP